MFAFPVASSPEALGLPSGARADFVRELDAMDTMHALVVLRHGLDGYMPY